MSTLESMQVSQEEIIKAMEILLVERMFWTAGRPEFERQGWSHEIEEASAIRDVNYRGAKLYKNAYEAVRAALTEEIQTRRARDSPLCGEQGPQDHPCC